MASPPNRARARTPRAETQLLLPAGVRCVSLRDLGGEDFRSGGPASPAERSAAASAVRASLRDAGACVLRLGDVHGTRLTRLVELSRAPLELAALGSPPHPAVRLLAHGKSVVEFRKHDELLSVEHEVASSRVYDALASAGRAVLAALGTTPQGGEQGGGSRRGAALSSPALAVAEDRVPEWERGCSILCSFRYPPGAFAAEHTDAGLVTLIHCSTPGLEVFVSGAWAPLPCPPGGCVAVLAGATLEAASAGRYAPVLHRVAATERDARPRESLAFRMRGLPGAFVPDGRTVAVFEAGFRSTRASANAPCRAHSIEYINLFDPLFEDEGASKAPPPPPASVAEAVFCNPQLAGLIAERVARENNSGRSLAIAACVSKAAHSATLGCWAGLFARAFPDITVPQRLDARGDGPRWRRLFRIQCRTIKVGIADKDGAAVFFRALPSTLLETLFVAWCKHTGVSRQSMRFVFDGCCARPGECVHDMGLEDGDEFGAMVEQVGD